ncbi:MAG: diguanylate cyclase [Chitinivorax sp.]
MIRSFGLRQAGNIHVLVLEYFTSTNLAQLPALRPLSLADKLGIALQLTAALSDVHACQLIHCDIAAKNVLIDPHTLRLKLCDFGLSSRLDHLHKAGDERHLRGTLEYISPEQTGRTSLEADYRSDFYSLGVVLYELFLGAKPFTADEPLALLHAHIASMPTPLQLADAGIPQTISDMVQKLLAKNPDQRYQSSRGLQADLQKCLEQWVRQQRIEPFTLAQADVPERFCIPNKLYGREAECGAILAAFARASQGSAELLLVAGYSGIGKSALVNELHQPIVARDGYFIRGKCDQFSRNQPYSGLLQAFQPLLRQLLSESPQRLAQSQQRLHAALGENAAVLCGILPDLALLTGEPEPLQPLPAAEMENRFHIAFTRLVDAIATPQQPLVLFLDDLQWADLSTLKLLEKQVLNDAARSLLIIGAYRDNEVDDSHPLSGTLAAIERNGGRIGRLQLSNLTFQHLQQLIADTLRSSSGEVAPLAALCWDKTQGNPFFLKQFLTDLHAHGDIGYQRTRGVWQWNIERIRQRDITDNVVELMLARLQRLDTASRLLLAQAAYLGGNFDMQQLALAGQQPLQQCAETLWPALRDGLIVPLNEEYKFVHTPEKLAQARYRFLHDRVQQAAHSLTPEAQRAQLQLRIGRLLLAHTPPAQLEGRLFSILEQLNPAIDLIDSAAERAQVLALNLRAGIKAKEASALPTAVTLLRHAHKLLADDAWQAEPQQTLTLYKELAEAEYLAGDFAAAEALYPQALQDCPDALAQVTIGLVQAQQYLIQGRFHAALPVLHRALALLDESFPATDAEAAQLFPQLFQQTEQLLARYSQAQRLNAAEMQQPQYLLTMRIFFALSYATYQTGQFSAFVVNACKMVQTTLRHGQCDLSCIGYVAYVTAMSVSGQPYGACYRMGRLAQILAEQRPNKYYRLTIYQYFSAFYQHWGEPLQNSFVYLDRGLDWGREGINPLSAGYCALLGSVNRFVHGTNLADLEQECRDGLKFLQQSHQPNTEDMLRHGVLQPLLALQGKTLGPLSFDSADTSSTQFFNGDYRTPSIHLALHSAAMLRHACLLDDCDLWQRYAASLPLIAQCLPDSPSMVDACFHAALARLRWAGDDAQQLALASECRDRLQRWADDCSDNFRCKYLLLDAEIARLGGDDARAMQHYAQAIDAAVDADQAICAALAHELYARFWLQRQQPQLAGPLIQQAYHHYQLWGASVKCSWLERHWPAVTFRIGASRHTTSARTKSYKKVSEQTDLLDLQSLLKANQLLSEEIQLESLLQKMLEVLLENAGAQQGAIVVAHGDELVVEVTGAMLNGRQTSHTRLGRPLAEVCAGASPLLPEAIIRHVQGTHATLLLNRPAEDERFSRNSYLRQQQPKSVLCLPILMQGKLVALVYLENNLLENAFTARQKKILETLSTQAAISLVNAHMYDSLEEKVRQRTDELRQMSMKDGLTGIANRRAFDERLEAEWRRCARHAQSLSLLMIDIDYFKQYNDHYGHVEGDHCIRAIARTLAQSASRAGDLVARYGGEEFVILLADCDADRARQLAHTCLNMVAELALPHAASAAVGRVSISIGVGSMPAQAGCDAGELLQQADRALYQAKQQGRNRCCG